MNAADKEKITGIAALTFTCSVTVVFYLFVKNALSAIKVRKYASKHHSPRKRYIKGDTPATNFKFYILDICKRDDGNGKRVAS